MSIRSLLIQSAQHAIWKLLQGFAVILVLLALTFAVLIGTPTGRAWSAEQLLGWLNHTTTWHIEAQNIQSHQIGHWSVGRLQVYDAQQPKPWLDLFELDLRLPWQQIRTHWHIRVLSIGAAELDFNYRQPPTEPASSLWPEFTPARLLEMEQLRIETLHIRQDDFEHSGTLEGDLQWLPSARLPKFNLQWQPNKATKLIVNAAGEGHWSGQWISPEPLSDPRQWPEGQPLQAEFELNIDLDAQLIDLVQLSVEGWFAPISISGQVRQQAQQWQVEPLQLRVGESVSDLAWRQTPEGMSLESHWQIPLWVINPWLPSEIAAGWDDPYAVLSAQLNILPDQSWSMAAELDTRWDRAPAQINGSGSGQQAQIDNVLFTVILGTSELTITGAWIPELSHSELQIEGQIEPVGLPRSNNMPAPDSLMLQADIIINEPLASLAETPLAAQWQLNTFQAFWPADTLLPVPVEASILGSGQMILAAQTPTIEGQWQAELVVDQQRVDAELLGHWNQTETHLTGNLTTDYAGHTLLGQMSWQDDRLESLLTWQDRRLTVNATQPLAADAQWQLAVENITDDDIAVWVNWPPGLPQFSARHNLEVIIMGSPETAHIEFTSSHRGVWQTAAITASAQGSAQWQQGQLTQWHIAPMVVNWQDAQLTFNAQNANQSWWLEQLEVTFDTVPLNALWTELEPVDGMLNGTLQLTSTPTDWRSNLNLDLQGQYQSEPLSAQIGLTAQGREFELINIDLQRLAVGYGDTLAIAGSGGLNAELWDLQLNWRGLVGSPPKNWPVPNAPWQGQGHIRLQGASDNPDITLAQQWNTIWILSDNETIPWQLKQSIQSAPTEYVMHNALTAAGRQQLEAVIKLPRTSWLERAETPISEWVWQAQAVATTELDKWMSWLDINSFLAEGTLTGEAQWQGPLSELQFDLDTQWSNGTFQLPVIGLEATHLALRMRGDQSHPIQLSGSGNLGDGRVNLNGTLDPRTYPWSIEADMTLNQAMLLQRPEVQSAASGLLQLKGTWPELALMGELALNDFAVNLNRLGGSSVAQLEIHNESEPEPILLPINMDIDITTDGFATISGNGLNAQLSGDVRLLGTPQSINTEGALTIASGQFNLLTRNFVLTEGQLRLIDETIHLFIVATHQRGDVEIQATLRGPIDALQLSLRSDPMLPEDEIVAQLLFGKAVQNMSPWQALQLANAINQLRGGESLDLFLATRDTLGLDTLEIDTADDSESPVTLRIGRYLNSRIYLELDTELDADRSLTGRVELELTPNLFLETQTGGRGGRFHLRWRRDY